MACCLWLFVIATCFVVCGVRRRGQINVNDYIIGLRVGGELENAEFCGEALRSCGKAVSILHVWSSL
jgi:hypothetical protein